MWAPQALHVKLAAWKVLAFLNVAAFEMTQGIPIEYLDTEFIKDSSSRLQTAHKGPKNEHHVVRITFLAFFFTHLDILASTTSSERHFQFSFTSVKLCNSMLTNVSKKGRLWPFLPCKQVSDARFCWHRPQGNSLTWHYCIESTLNALRQSWASYRKMLQKNIIISLFAQIHGFIFSNSYLRKYKKEEPFSSTSCITTSHLYSSFV